MDSLNKLPWYLSAEVLWTWELCSSEWPLQEAMVVAIIHCLLKNPFDAQTWMALLIKGGFLSQSFLRVYRYTSGQSHHAHIMRDIHCLTHIVQPNTLSVWPSLKLWLKFCYGFCLIALEKRRILFPKLLRKVLLGLYWHTSAAPEKRG